MAEPLVSCLCITHERPAFMPWLLWSYERQTWARRELVIVDSSPVRYVFPERPDVRIVRVSQTDVPSKRNIALEHARGELVAWFDDDDWQHTERLTTLVHALAAGAPFAGGSSAWFVDPVSESCQAYTAMRGRVIFNGAVFRRECIDGIRFDESRRRATDTVWLREVEARCGAPFVLKASTPLCSWLSHEHNLSNPRARRRCHTPLAQLQAAVGEAAWGNTGEQLRQLRERLGSAQPPAPLRARPPVEARTTVEARTSALGRRSERVLRSFGPRGTAASHGGTTAAAGADTAAPARAPRRSSVPIGPAGAVLTTRVDPEQIPSAEQLASLPPASIVIKATILDAPFLETMVTHMVTQAKFPFADRLVVVDPRVEFSGKYHDRLRGTRSELDQTLARLLEAGVIDRVLEAPPDPARARELNELYFGRNVPTHDWTGSPVYPALLGLEDAKTDHVLLMDSDMYFHASGGSWVAEALRLMQEDPKLWLMMTHSGPLHLGFGLKLSFGARNLRRGEWDATRRLWLFRHATTRYFLADRRLLRGKIPALWRGNEIEPLEDCIGAGLREHGGFRGNLVMPGSWDLHPYEHGALFMQWHREIARYVERGIVPSCQLGSYNLQLELPLPRLHWRKLLERGTPSPLAATSTSNLAPSHLAPVRDSD